jgi:aminopeptidase-like protein
MGPKKTKMDKREKRMLAMISEIFPLHRMINSPGLDKAFEIVQREFPGMIIHEYPTGMECEDWIVPHSWEVLNGVMKDSSNRVIASTEECHLFVAPYSEAVEGWFTKEEIAKHLRTRPDQPDAFFMEHRYAYNYQLVDWGITLPYNRWINLSEGKYYIKIEIATMPGTMKVGEYLIPGRRSETICLCAHIDELCNDDLTGCAVAAEMIRYVEGRTACQYSYQMLLVPEMFGTIFYAYNNWERTRKTIGMLNLEALGTGEMLCLKKGLSPNTRLESALRAALKNKKILFKELEFFQGYENDERVYSWPTIGVTGIGLQRYPFPQYHTSGDNPLIIEGMLLMQALEIGEKFIEIMENDYLPKYKKKLPPWLTRRGLYFDSKDDPAQFQKFNNLVLFHIDGSQSVLDLAVGACLDFDILYAYLEKFVENSLVAKDPIIWDEKPVRLNCASIR